MKKLKPYLRPFGIGLGLLVIALALGFVERTADRTPITDLQVRSWRVRKVYTSSTRRAVRRESAGPGHRRDGVAPSAEWM
jgi:hypothetical protein